MTGVQTCALPIFMNWNLSCSLCLFRNKDISENGNGNQLETQTFSWNIDDNITQISNMTLLELNEFTYDKIVESDEWFSDAILDFKRLKRRCKKWIIK